MNLRMLDEWGAPDSMLNEFKAQMELHKNFNIVARENQMNIKHITINKLPVGTEVTIIKEKY